MHEDPSASREKLKTVAFIYEAVPVPADEDADQHSDAKVLEKVLFYNLADGKLKTLVDKVTEVIGVEQVAKDRTLLLFKDQNKRCVLTIKTNTGEQLSIKDLPSIIQN